MIVGKLYVNGVKATAESLAPVTSGMVGAQIELSFANSLWAGLSRTVVFRASSCVRDVIAAGTVVDVPHEVLARHGVDLMVGVYGANSNGTLVIPTVWASLGRILAGTDPSGDQSTDPSLPVWAQMQAEIEELKQNTGGGVDPEKVGKLVEEYLTENPPKSEPGPQGPQGPQGEPGYTPQKSVDYYTEEDKAELVSAVLAALPTWEGGSY